MERIGFEIDVSRNGWVHEIDFIRDRIVGYAKEINYFLQTENKNKELDSSQLDLLLWYLDELKWLLASVRGVSMKHMDKVERYLKRKQD
jgi:hypothetical protein